MEHQVRLEKTGSGWRATTDVPLEAPRVLRFVTRKHEVNGRAAGVSTNASVHKIEGNSMTFELFGDYSATVTLDDTVRSTEKTVALVHAKALAKLDVILAGAKAFYVAKDAKDAAKAAAKAVAA